VSLTLHLGVIDMPYTSYDGGRKAANPKRRGKRPVKASARKARTVTTAQVAGWLEDRYHVMEVFYENDGGVVELLNESVDLAMEGLLMGKRVEDNPFLEATSEIQSRFKQFLSSGEIETLGIADVPTKAAKEGISSRFKLGRRGGWIKRKASEFGVRRPSFIDTGLYQSSFMAWVE